MKLPAATIFTTSVVLCLQLQAQTAQPLLRVGAIPPHARPLLRASETRYSSPGKERLSLTGVVTDSRGDTNTKITLELPFSSKYEETSGPGKSIAFDGSKTAVATALGESEYDLLETLTVDSAAYFFYSLSSGAANRFLGSRFRIDDGKNKTYAGPWLCIVELVTPLQFRADKSLRQKFFVFDTATQQLRAVRYEITRGTNRIPVEIQLSNYTQVDGHMVPGLIVRNEAGTKKMEYRLSLAAFSNKVNDGLFGRP